MDERKAASVTDFFEGFVVAFSSFDGYRVASKFILPCLAKGPGNSSSVFLSRSQLAEYFQGYLDDYYSQGCRKCRYSAPEIKWLGSEGAVATVTWNLVDTSGVLVTSWSESYMLSLAGGEALAFATVDHVEE